MNIPSLPCYGLSCVILLLMTGSDAYWSKAKEDLKTTIQQVGPQTFFFTFSSGQFHNSFIKKSPHDINLQNKLNYSVHVLIICFFSKYVCKFSNFQLSFTINKIKELTRNQLDKKNRTTARTKMNEHSTRSALRESQAYANNRKPNKAPPSIVEVSSSQEPHLPRCSRGFHSRTVPWSWTLHLGVFFNLK